MGHAGHLAGLCCGQGLVYILPFGLALRILIAAFCSNVSMHLKAARPGQGFMLHMRILCKQTALATGESLSADRREGEARKDITEDVLNSPGIREFSLLPVTQHAAR